MARIPLGWLRQYQARDEGSSKAALIRRYVRERLPPLGPIENDPLWDLVGQVEGAADDSSRIDDVVRAAARPVIFVDTSFWIALTTALDARHDDAVQLLRRHGAEPLVTSAQVRGETWTFIRRRYGLPMALTFLDSLQRTRRVGTVFVTEEIEVQALGRLRRHDERAYSFVDATSFALMRSLRVTRALAYDEDFVAAGFEQLRA